MSTRRQVKNTVMAKLCAEMSERAINLDYWGLENAYSEDDFARLQSVAEELTEEFYRRAGIPRRPVVDENQMELPLDDLRVPIDGAEAAEPTW